MVDCFPQKNHHQGKTTFQMDPVFSLSWVDLWWDLGSTIPIIFHGVEQQLPMKIIAIKKAN
jgi:hypothetical protein